MKAPYRCARSAVPRYTNQLSSAATSERLGMWYGHSFETIVFIVSKHNMSMDQSIL